MVFFFPLSSPTCSDAALEHPQHTVGKVTGASSGGVRLDAAWQRHSKERLCSLQTRKIFDSQTRVARKKKTHTHTHANPFLSPTLTPLIPPTRYVSFRDESRVKVAIALCRCLSLTVGDSGRLRSLSTETLQHMRSFLKEWPQNPH